MRDSTEVIELMRPIRIWNDQILLDTEGAGRFRSAPSLYVEYGPVDTQLEVMYASDGRINPAMGARGGRPGGTLWPYKRTRTGKLEELDMSGHVFLEAGETIVSVSPAGGGYGLPVERDPERVSHDMVEGWISRERAAAVYGVIMDVAGNIDREATVVQRGELAKKPVEEIPPIGKRVPRPLSATAKSVLENGGDSWSRTRAGVE